MPCKGKLDGILKTIFSETRWFCRANVFSGLEYLKTMVTANQVSIYLPFCALTLFYHWWFTHILRAVVPITAMLQSISSDLIAAVSEC